MDLFSGAGGFSLGLELAGLLPVGAVEADRFACETFKHNFPHTPLFEGDIRNLTKPRIQNQYGGVELIVAGPPCQGFSVAGPSQYGIIDERNYLILEVLRFVKILSPRFFIVENVKGLLSGRLSPEKKAFKEFIGKVQEAGYETKHFVLQAADYGVPQWRERVFIFGARHKNDLPEEIPRRFGNITQPWCTVWDALSDLPPADYGTGQENFMEYISEAKNPYQQWLRSSSNGLTNHVAMKHTQRLIARFLKIPIGGSLVDVPAEFGQRVRNGSDLDIRSRFKMNNQRLDPKKISTAITASFQSNFVHPFLHRNLTAREGARLQSFPDRFTFLGPRTLMSKSLLKREGRHDEIGLSQYNQIGNAVPPLMAHAVGMEIIKKL
ncbi:DNA cytosine methyltransferase [Nitrosospira sp. Nsp18]|uniref:DNA cytosine methyltransferase n=1 Tax=Nitrosospira sp. Nsp18 TaxID=1855334 RepID=UPI0015A2A3A4|nr:DNA cytosine methyltransferase [Nitrosospira sp. Nsp18]